MIDFNRFEEEFKLGTLGMNHNDDADSLQSFGSKRFKKPELVTLLEHNRLRNIGRTFEIFLKGTAWPFKLSQISLQCPDLM